jgi:hypothetical protein
VKLDCVYLIVFNYYYYYYFDHLDITDFIFVYLYKKMIVSGNIKRHNDLSNILHFRKGILYFELSQ